jgi:phosphohistidine phosphatase SixA
MKLYFLRHADAASGYDDAARALTPKGTGQCQRLGWFCKQAGIAFEACYASPLVRARQTAEGVLRACQPEDPPKILLTNALLSESNPAMFDDWLDAIPGVKNILLVGHAPSLAAHARRMLGLGNHDALSLSKAAMVCLRTEDRRTAALKFHITAKMLAAPDVS